MKHLLSAFAAVALIACAGAPPTPPPPASTATTAPAPTAAPSPTPASAATAPATVPASVPTPTMDPPPAPTQPPPTATRAPPRSYVVQKEGSKLRLVVNETLARIKLPTDAVLETTVLAGRIMLDGDGNVHPESKFTVDLRTLKSDDEDRDFDVQENILETAKFPTGTLVPKELRGLPKPLPLSGPVKGQLTGDLTVHGVTKPVVFEVEGTLDAESFRGKGVTDVLLTDFGMTIPTLAVLLRVDNKVHAEITLHAKRE